jgi:hypothetical protein
VADEKRSYDAARVSYPNKDSYFGGYADDFKSGKGLYTFANGAIYIGEDLAGTVCDSAPYKTIHSYK